MFWKSRNYEKELELLAEKVRKSRAKAQKAKLNNRRYRSLFILYTIGLYCVYLVVAISTHSYKTTETKLRLVGLPIIIYLIYRLLSLWLVWRQESTANHLKAVQNTREGLIQEYKEKVNYSQIQKVLASGSEDEPDSKQLKSRSSAAKSPAAAAGTPKIKVAPARAPAASSPSNKNKPLTKDELKEKIKRENGVWPAKPAVAPQTPKQQSAALRPPVPMSPMPMSPMAPPPHSWMDRIADLVLGENEASPNSRHALICPVCYTHNGLAQFGENPEDVVYRCPVCGTLNGKPKDSHKPDGTPGHEGSPKVAKEAVASKGLQKSPEMLEK